MFVDIDYNKRPKKMRLHLAKPNKQIVSHISEKFNDELSVKLGNVNELNFSIPHYIMDDESGDKILNPHTETIKEKMLIRAKMGVYSEWFIVDSIEEDADDSDIFNVSAFSLGYELAGKRISGFETESMNATEIATQLLDQTIWVIKEIDPMFNEMYRSFESGDDSNALDCITQWAETFGGLIVWDTENRQISLKNPNEEGQFKGLTVSYGRFLRTLKRTRTTDEMVTRLWVYGSEDLSIHSVNPTGQGYIEDFSFFMHPFERDANKKVIKSSYFMSDALCHAILDQKELLQANASNIKTISDELTTKRATLITEQSKLDTLEAELENIVELLDTAKAVLANLESDPSKPDTTSEKADVANLTKQRNAKQSEVDTQKIVVNKAEKDVNDLEDQLNTIQNDINSQANFTEELLEELNPYIIESTWRDDNYINANDLYKDALEKFVEIRQPKVVIEVDIDNLMNIVEEQYYWDKIALGELIKVKYHQMNIEYMAKIIEIKYDLEEGTATLTIANTSDLLSDNEKLIQLLYSNSSASSLVQNNKYKWNKVNAVSRQVSNLLSSEWDANKQKIIAGVHNSIEVGNRGIIISNPDIPNEIVIMQAGIIALSKDGGETWKTAIKPDGIVAERLIGQIIAGEELMITNASGSFTLDNNGAVFDVDKFILRSGQTGNLVDRWQKSSDFIDEYRDDNLVTAYEKKMLKLEWEKMQTVYNANLVKVDNYYDGTGDQLGFVVDYKNTHQALYEYLFVTPFGDKPMLADDNMAYTTRVDGTEFNTKFRDFQNAQVELEKQLDLRAKQLSDNAKSLAQDAQNSIDEVKDEVAYKLELSSSNGWIFKNGQISTTIVAKVYHGKNDITSTIPPSGFIWRKIDKDGRVDTSWGTAHTNVGNRISITKNDVDQKATFECDIDIA